MPKSVKAVDGISLEIQVEKLGGFLTEGRQGYIQTGGIGGGCGRVREKLMSVQQLEKKKTTSLSPVASWIWCNPPLLKVLRRKLRAQRLPSVLLWPGGSGSWKERRRFEE